MSGSDDDRPAGGGGGGGGNQDPCLQTRRGPINSPKASVLATLKVGDVLDVVVDRSTARPVLAVEWQGKRAGSLTFVGYLEIIECIEKRGVNYQAVLLNIAGGVHEVRVEPI